MALSVAEHDRTLIEQKPELGRAALVAARARMRRAFAMRAARASSRLTPFDGVLTEAAAAHLVKVRDPKNEDLDRAFSP